jgi:hypothetical protein
MKNFNRYKAFFLPFAVMTGVWLLAHWQGLISPYVINDDVRQQIYWMQQFQDARLFPDDLLTAYARAYVPWGVQLIYRAAAPFINPVQFSKVLAAVLFISTGVTLFLFVRREAGETAALMALCGCCFLGQFLGTASGGLSRGFVFPLMLLHLYFLSGNRLLAASMIVGLQSLFNPYLFLLSFFTHLFYCGHRCYNVFFSRSRHPQRLSLLLSQAPAVAGALLILFRHLVLAPEGFGALVTLEEMSGRAEYTAAGRFPLLPVPSILFELVRPFCTDLPTGAFSIAAGLLGGG